MKRYAFPRSRFGWFVILAALGTIADLWTKTFVFNWLGMPGEQGVAWCIPGVLGIQTSLNEGALFGMGQGMVPFFCGISLVSIGAILFWLFGLGYAKSRFWTCVFALLTAGVLGNLYDRMGFPGLVWNYATSLHNVGEPVYAVRDWILVMLGSYPWPNFNLADSFLVVGAGLVLWTSFWENEREKKKNEPSQDS